MQLGGESERRRMMKEKREAVDQRWITREEEVEAKRILGR